MKYLLIIINVVLLAACSVLYFGGLQYNKARGALREISVPRNKGYILTAPNSQLKAQLSVGSDGEVAEIRYTDSSKAVVITALVDAGQLKVKYFNKKSGKIISTIDTDDDGIPDRIFASGQIKETKSQANQSPSKIEMPK